LTLVTGRKARFDLIPPDVYLKTVGAYTGKFVAMDLLEMYDALSTIGFAAAGEPEPLKNTEQVTPHGFQDSDIVAWSSPQYLGRIPPEDRLERSRIGEACRLKVQRTNVSPAELADIFRFSAFVVCGQQLSQ
jgi:hypothetical protein